MKSDPIVFLDNFLSHENFARLKDYVVSTLGDDQNITLKRDEHILNIGDLIAGSNYNNSEIFSKISSESYINISNRKIQKPSWHLDHSELTLVIPIFLSGRDLGLKYVDLCLPSFFSPIINRFFISTIVKYCKIKQVNYQENNAILIRGRSLIHTAAYDLIDTDKRIVLVMHF